MNDEEIVRTQMKNREIISKSSEVAAIVAESILGRFSEQTSDEDIQKWIELYSTHAWVYAGAFAIASTISALPFQLYKLSKTKQDEDEEMLDHPVLDLLNFPNDQKTKEDHLESLIIYLETCGEGYWEVVYEKKGVVSQPIELWNIMPSRMTPVPDKEGKGIASWIFQTRSYAKKKIFKREQIIPFRYTHPLKDWRGQGSLLASRNDIQLDFNMMDWNKAFFAGGTVLDGVFTTDQSLTAASLKNVKEQILAKVQGGGHKTLVLTNNLKYDPISSNPKDLEWESGHKNNRNTILSTMGVPPIKVGILDQAKYDNYRLQEDSFHRDTIVPKLKKISGTLSLYLLPMFGLNPREHQLRFDTTTILSEDQDRQTTRITTQIKHGLKTPNEGRGELGLDAYDGGDIYYVEKFLVPIAGDDYVEPVEEEPEGKPEVLEETLEKREDELLNAVNDIGENMNTLIKDEVKKAKAEILEEVLAQQRV